jgi:hypothetical protein
LIVIYVKEPLVRGLVASLIKKRRVDWVFFFYRFCLVKKSKFYLVKKLSRKYLSWQVPVLKNKYLLNDIFLLLYEFWSLFFMKKYIFTYNQFLNWLFNLTIILKN